MAGLIHIYCGDGKGKTTAAAGLSLRAAACGKRVVFTQFFKDGSSGEVKLLETIPKVKTIICREKLGFFFKMDDEQKKYAQKVYSELFIKACKEAENSELLVLDEIISACNHGAVNEEKLIEFLKSKPQELEVVLTGRNPSEKLLALGDYVTEMKKIKHPFDDGIKARKGIEF